MVTQAEIQSIDFNSNSCIVRIPFFETAGTLEPFIAEAKICIQPGIYNGYKPGDTVWVSFINNRHELPIIICKIYQNLETEKNNTGSVIVSPSIEVSDQASIPNNTKITNTFSDFDTIQKIISNIKNLQEKIEDSD